MLKRAKIRNRGVALASACALVVGIIGVGAPQAHAAPASMPVASSGAPTTIPALGSWTAGSGAFQFRTDTAVVGDSSELRAQLAGDLELALGQDIAEESGAADAGDIVLRLDSSRQDELGQEGYAVEVGEKITVTAAADTGLFYGGQSIVQWAVQAGLSKSIPAGAAVDVPEYPVRGVGVCACQIQISVESLAKTIEQMSYYKLNELWIELKVESEAFPEATFWSYYTTEEAKYLSDLAAEHHVTIIPQVNSPGHMGPWLKYLPELQLKNKNGVPQAAQLDISKPEALEVVKTLADEYLEQFDTPYWHMGADEYLLGSGQLTDYPQLLAKAKELFGDEANERDLFVWFINQINAHVKAKGKTLRIWNDGIKDYNIVKLDSDIIVEHWDYTTAGNRTPAQFLDEGNDLVNTDSRFYFTRNGAWGNAQARWNENWTPLNFAGKAIVDDSATDGKVLGAKMMLWPDNGPGMTENELFRQAQETLKFMAQATWGSPRPFDGYADFKSLGDRLGVGPATSVIDPSPVAAGSYAIAAGGKYLTPASRVKVGDDKVQWSLTPTSDGYYTIAADGNCLVMRGGNLTLNSPQDFGLDARIEACATTAPSLNLQKWWLKAADRGYTLINATTQLPLVVSGTKVTQEDPHVADATVFQLVGDGVTAVASSSDRLVAGHSTTIPVSVQNLSVDDATDVVVRAVVQKGWVAKPASIKVGDLRSQGSTSADFVVTPGAGAAGMTSIEFEVTATVNGSSLTTKTSAPVAFSCAADVTSPATVKYVSSEQNDPQEVAPASRAIDGNPNTFWHTQWSPNSDEHPHTLVVEMPEAGTICAASLTPRQGVSAGAANGQIKEYELYVSADAAVLDDPESDAWGEPVSVGSLPPGQSVNWVPFDKVATGKYVKLVVLSAQNPAQGYATLGELSFDVAQPDNEAPVLGDLPELKAKVGEQVEYQIQAADASEVTYAVSGLPDGLTVNSKTGLISGKAVKAGETTATVVVTDSEGLSSEASLVITITEGGSGPTPEPTPTREPTPTVKPSPTAAPSVTAKPSPTATASTGTGTAKPGQPGSRPGPPSTGRA